MRVVPRAARVRPRCHQRRTSLLTGSHDQPRRSDDERGGLQPWWRRIGVWLSPAALWRQLRREGAERRTVARGVAIGVFIGNLPVYGLHTILSLYCAKRLNLHPLSVVLGSQISTPPLGPILIVAAIHLGFVVTTGRAPTLADFDPATLDPMFLLGRVLLEWSVGGILLGLILAAAAFVLVLALGRTLDRGAGGTASSLDADAAPVSDSTDRR